MGGTARGQRTTTKAATTMGTTATTVPTAGVMDHHYVPWFVMGAPGADELDVSSLPALPSVLAVQRDQFAQASMAAHIQAFQQQQNYLAFAQHQQRLRLQQMQQQQLEVRVFIACTQRICFTGRRRRRECLQLFPTKHSELRGRQPRQATCGLCFSLTVRLQCTCSTVVAVVAVHILRGFRSSSSSSPPPLLPPDEQYHRNSSH
jgi:hypothetical protein